MTLAAQKLIQPSRIRFERQFRDFTLTLRTLPIALIHFAVKVATAAAIIVVKSHFVSFDPVSSRLKGINEAILSSLLFIFETKCF